MAMTLAEKLCARAAGRDTVSPGEIVTAKVDLAMIHDSGGPRRVKPMLAELGVGVWDPAKVVLISDHYVPAVDAESAAILDLTRKWAAANDIDNFHDMQGICHVVLPERGHLRPGMFVAGGDSHSTTGGAFGCFMIGIGATEMAGVLATGEIWVRVPPTIRLEWNGMLDIGVAAKDMMLKMCGDLGMAVGNYKAVEFSGSTIDGLSMTERMVMSNMAAELGGKVGLIAPDQTTADYVTAAGGDPDDPTGDWRQWTGDPDAEVEAHHVFDADALPPMVAAPHSPENSAPGGGNRARAHRPGLYRRLHGREAFGPAHGGGGAARAQGGEGRTSPDRAGLDARDPAGGRRRHARRPGRGGRHRHAERLRGLRRIRGGRAGGRRGLHLLDRAQLQGPHGPSGKPGLPRLAPIPWRHRPWPAKSPTRANC